MTECPRCCGNGQTFGPNSGEDIICPDCKGTGRTPSATQADPRYGKAHTDGSRSGGQMPATQAGKGLREPVREFRNTVPELVNSTFSAHPATQADDALVPRDVAESWKAKAENYQKERTEALEDIADFMGTIVDNWPVPRKLSTAIALVKKTLASMVSFDELARREAAAHAARRAAERAEVVAWLRQCEWFQSAIRFTAAQCIERGQHKEAGK